MLVQKFLIIRFYKKFVMDKECDNFLPSEYLCMRNFIQQRKLFKPLATNALVHVSVVVIAIRMPGKVLTLLNMQCGKLLG